MTAIKDNPAVKMLRKRIIDNAQEVQEHNDTGAPKKTPIHFSFVSVTAKGLPNVLAAGRHFGIDKFDKLLNDVSEFYSDIEALQVEIFNSQKATAGEKLDIIFKEKEPVQQPAVASPLSGPENSAAGDERFLKMQFQMEKMQLQAVYDNKIRDEREHYLRQISILQEKNKELENEKTRLEEKADELNGALNGPDGKNSDARIFSQVLGGTLVKVLAGEGGKRLLNTFGFPQDAVLDIISGFGDDAKQQPQLPPPVAGEATFEMEDDSPRGKQQAEITRWLKSLTDEEFAAAFQLVNLGCHPQTHEFMLPVARVAMVGAIEKLKASPELFVQNTTTEKTENNA